MKTIFILAFILVASNGERPADHPMENKPMDMPSKPNMLTRPAMPMMGMGMMDKGNDSLAAAAAETVEGAVMNKTMTNCNCPFNFSPICGSNGVTYTNDCQFACGQKADPTLTKKSNGECDMMMNMMNKKDMARSRRDDACGCAADYAPVCGSDGQTYSNGCKFECAHKKMPSLTMKAGKCDPMMMKTDMMMPMMSNKTTRAADDCMCTMENKPLCGSDGKTYSNSCQFECAQKKDPKLIMMSMGMCMMMTMDDKNRTRRDDASCMCMLEYKPVCGSDSMTYSNMCQFMCAQKKNKTLTSMNGPCNGTAPSMMPMMGMMAMNDKSGPQPAVLFNRPEKDSAPCVCPQNYEPICGSDGKTYTNVCDFNCGLKMNSGLKMTKKDAC